MYTVYADQTEIAQLSGRYQYDIRMYNDIFRKINIKFNIIDNYIINNSSIVM